MAEAAGLTLPSGARADMSEATAEYEVGNYNMAFNLAKGAVDEARDFLKGSAAITRSRSAALIDSINTKMDEAIMEGIDVSAFTEPFANCMAIYNAEDYLASLVSFSDLRDDLAHYIAAAREGRITDPLSGSYDIPAGTTDIFVLNLARLETQGWIPSDPATLRSKVESALREVEPEAEVLGLRIKNHRAVVYAKGSPIAAVAIAIIVVAIGLAAAACLAAYGFFWYAPARRAKEHGKTRRHSADLIEDYNEHVADLVGEGKISSEEASELIDDNTDAVDQVNPPEPGPGFMSMLKWVGVGVIGLVGFSVAWPMVRESLRRKRGGIPRR